jgi:hypothetical protein
MTGFAKQSRVRTEDWVCLPALHLAMTVKWVRDLEIAYRTSFALIGLVAIAVSGGVYVIAEIVQFIPRLNFGSEQTDSRPLYSSQPGTMIARSIYRCGAVIPRGGRRTCERS